MKLFISPHPNEVIQASFWIFVFILDLKIIINIMNPLISGLNVLHASYHFNHSFIAQY